MKLTPAQIKEILNLDLGQGTIIFKVSNDTVRMVNFYIARNRKLYTVDNLGKAEEADLTRIVYDGLKETLGDSFEEAIQV